MKVGLYFGSFNPVHIGHLAIANYILEYSDLRQIWFVISPQNPLKSKHSLLEDHYRLRLLEMAVKEYPQFAVSDVEFRLPLPSYTIDTLTYLKETFASYEFTLIMGSDNWDNFHKWKNYEQLLKQFEILVYPRPGFNEKSIDGFNNVKLIHAPQMEISSSFIRQAIKDGKDIPCFLPKKVYQFIKEKHFYE